MVKTNIEDGQVFGKLTVIRRVEDVITKNGYHIARYLCECSCPEHNRVIVREGNLKGGNTTSCGCNKKMFGNKNPNRKYNDYEIFDDIAFVKFSNCEELFICDADFWDKRGKNHSWYKNAAGYAVSRINGKLEYMHRIITGYSDYFEPDHIYRVSNGVLDNRRSNLELKTHRLNSVNTGKRKDNTSGYTGVRFDKRSQKWYASITVDKVVYYLGYYINKEDAVKVRLQAEHDLLGINAPQRHLFKKFNVDDSDLKYNENSFVNPNSRIIQ